MSEKGAFRRLWDKVIDLLFDRDDSYDLKEQKSRENKFDFNKTSLSGDESINRYEVLSENGDIVGGSDTLKEAHKLWQDLTKQNGIIIDTLTGQDVTPEPDDSGRYIVLDENNKQVGSYDNIEAAIEAWAELTGKQGVIIDLQTKQDITPRKEQYLSDEQIKELTRLIRGCSKNFDDKHNHLSIDPNLIERLAKQINRLPLPAFDIANIAGKSKALPTKTVPIKRRKVTIVKERKIVEEETTVKKIDSGRVTVPYPTDEPDLRPIQRVSELTRVPRHYLALPGAELARRLIKRELPVPVYTEEVNRTREQVKKLKVWRDIEVPKVEEWTEEVEVTDEPSAQLLEIVIDISGSMRNKPINLAIALATLMIGKHLDDGSRYFYRQFASQVGGLEAAFNKTKKQKLIKFLIHQTESDLGGGTNIIPAITEAAADVRATSKHDDRPEVLLITDGEDFAVNAETVYGAIGDDVVLHTVLVEPIISSAGLKNHSSTYYEIHWDGVNVQGSSDMTSESRPLATTPQEEIDDLLERLRNTLSSDDDESDDEDDEYY